MSAPPNEVTCNFCYEAFEANLLPTKLPSGETMHYLVCPHCKGRFNVNVVTPEGMKLLSRLSEMRDAGMTDTSNYRRTLSRYQRHVRRPQIRLVEPPKGR